MCKVTCLITNNNVVLTSSRDISIKRLHSLPPKQLVKDLAIKHRRKLFCKFDGVWYQFKSPNEVIIPAYQAKNYALRYKKNLIDPIDIHDLKLDHLNSNETSKIPVVVLLGHFNHGKTTLLDALGGSKFVDEEKHKITQVKSCVFNMM